MIWALREHVDDHAPRSDPVVHPAVGFVGELLFPIMFVLLFGYVFGSGWSCPAAATIASS